MSAARCLKERDWSHQSAPLSEPSQGPAKPVDVESTIIIV